MALAIPSSQADNRRSIAWATNARYDEFFETWRIAREAYEGDGDFLSGSALVPHPREVLYDEVRATVVGNTTRYARRKRLAHYQNFASVVIDTFVDHQYAKPPTRESGRAAWLGQWWEDVDGDGTSIDEFARYVRTLANIFGHVYVACDFGASLQYPPVTQADLGPMRLTVYTPMEALDWRVFRRTLTSIKFMEVVEDGDVNAVNNIAMRFRIYTKDGWTLLDEDGETVAQGRHGFSQLPVRVVYGRRRATIPLMGSSLLRDPRLYVDHYNLYSEFRSILRDQTFSMFHVQLGEDESVLDARARLGDHAATDNIMFSRGPAGFVAPPDGPAATYMLALEALERKAFRLVGIPWEGDSRDAEAAESRRLKALDLNKALGRMSEDDESLEWWVAERAAEAVGVPGAMRDSDVSIVHSREFHIDDLITKVTEGLEAMKLNLGPRADAEIRKRAIPLVLPNLDEKTQKEITTEIDTRTEELEKERVDMHKSMVQSKNAAREEFA